MQVWQQPMQAKKAKKGAEALSSSACATVKSLSANFNEVHVSLARGLEVSKSYSSPDKAGSCQMHTAHL